ncbi:uncharacterized protein N0V89_003797 [Didymosphaeria variabile]|uniref:Uncharacterized protein n=1 Tax=Didymosphaeria variabile TaxID=1932322 RepID=A0A9W8XQM0_9PLEO|nr:uncharacterized protein N0V89_003797 [Didymosphaeria variabile]KAJ4355776.1 hypothetical protein N0V89_003797 [Didymosphaeria variabile]
MSLRTLTERISLTKTKMPAVTVTMENIDPHYRSEALTYAPCNQQSQFHKLKCGHTVRTNPGAPCGRNCSIADPEDSFICHMCIILIYDPSLTEDNCSSNIRYMLGDLGRWQMADAEEDIAEQMAKGLRPSDPAKAQDWLGDFFNEYGDAYTEKKVEKKMVEKKMVEKQKVEKQKVEKQKQKQKQKQKKRKRVLEDRRSILSENAVRNDREGRTLSGKRQRV